MKKSFIQLFIIAFSISAYSQQTVGVFEYEPETTESYVLFSPIFDTNTYLIDNCGDVHFKWSGNYTTGHSTYLNDDGSIYRAGNFSNGSPITAGGGGGIIEHISGSSVIWDFTYANDTVRLHHDYEILPNGNIVMIAWEFKDATASIQAGRHIDSLSSNSLWPDHLIEVDPTDNSIVWQWHLWDHLIQDVDNTKDNFGVVADHPEKMNINYMGIDSDGADWSHYNSVDYNADLDLLLMSSPFFSEILIIDHSTTTTEAKGSTGGNFGMGGDILWRWGNPAAYDSGTILDKKLFGQHDAKWIAEGLPYENQIMVFNNGRYRAPVEYSSVEVIAPQIQSNQFELNIDGTFAPQDFAFHFEAPTNTDIFSNIISGADFTTEGNLIICEGKFGRFLEYDTIGNKLWEYVNPVVSDSILAQEQVVPGGGIKFNASFRIERVYQEHVGLQGLNLVNQGPLERNPYPSSCMNSLTINENSNSIDYIIQNNSLSLTNNYNVVAYDLMGNMVKKCTNTNSFDLSQFRTGVYLIHIYDDVQKTTLKHAVIR